MQLKKITLQNFKKFTQAEFEFSKGINIVLGDNEMGKSTLSEALELVLYTSPLSGKKELLKYKNWQNNQGFKIFLEFLASGHSFTLSKDFENKEASLKGSNGVNLNNPDLIQNYLKEELKIPVLGIYLNSCFVGQDEIINLDNNNDFKNALQNLVVEGDEQIDVNAKLISLDKQIEELLKGVKKNSIHPGVIKTLQEEIALLESQINTAKLNWDKMQVSSTRLEGLQKHIDELAQKISENEELLKKQNKIFKYKEKLNDLNEKFELISSQENRLQKLDFVLKTNFEKIKKNFAKLAEITDIDVLVLSIHGLDSQKEVLTGNLGKTSLPSVLKDKLRTMDYFIGFALAMIGLIISLLTNNNWLFLILGFVVGTLYIFYKLVQIRSLSKTENLNDTYSVKLKQIEEEQQSLCLKFETGTPEELLEKINQYKILQKDISLSASEKKFILAENTETDLHNSSKTLLREMNKIDTFIEDQGLAKYKFSPEKINKIDFDLDKMRNDYKKDENEKFSLQAENKLSTGSHEQINVLEEELSSKKEKMDYFQVQVQVLSLVKDSMSQAFQETIHNSRGIIEKLINEQIEILTLGRYKEVKVDDELDISVFSKEKNDWVGLTEDLSKGTIDQIYLLARLGFGRALMGKDTMPFIFDDPFVNFDEARLQKLKEILLKLGEKYQIIIMSHNKVYRDWGRLVDL